MNPYYDAINVVGWLNENFGYHLDVPTFLEKWTDYDVARHFEHHDVYNDPATREAIKFQEAKRRGGGLRLIDGGKPDDAG